MTVVNVYYVEHNHFSRKPEADIDNQAVMYKIHIICLLSIPGPAQYLQHSAKAFSSKHHLCMAAWGRCDHSTMCILQAVISNGLNNMARASFMQTGMSMHKI